jgi:hypothetical protein
MRRTSAPISTAEVFVIIVQFSGGLILFSFLTNTEFIENQRYPFSFFSKKRAQ